MGNSLVLPNCRILCKQGSKRFLLGGGFPEDVPEAKVVKYFKKVNELVI